MAMEKPPKLSKIWYKNSGSLTGFQLEFSNGLKSTLFETKRASVKDPLNNIKVDTQRSIAKVSMRVASTYLHDLSKFRLTDEYSQNIVDLVWHNCHDGQWVTREIPKGKEIIGFYCNTSGKDPSANGLYRLGFIVWTPP